MSSLARAHVREQVRRHLHVRRREEHVDAAQDDEENADAARLHHKPHLETAHDALEEPDHAAARERSKTGARFWPYER